MKLVRLILLLLLTHSLSGGEATSAVSARLKTEFHEAYHYSPEIKTGEAPAILEEEPMLYLDPFVVTLPRSFQEDLLKASRRAADDKKATEFSPLTGGLLFSTRNGKVNVGIWPKLVPTEDGPLKKGVVGISIDLLRLKW